MANRRRNNQTALETIILGIFKVIGQLFKLAFGGLLGKKGLSVENRNFVTVKREEIERMTQSDNVHELRQAVFEADKLVDYILKNLGYGGETFADRLRQAEKDMPRNVYDNIWRGHKVRNQLAHEHNGEISVPELRGAVNKLVSYSKQV